MIKAKFKFKNKINKIHFQVESQLYMFFRNLSPKRLEMEEWCIWKLLKILGRGIEIGYNKITLKMYFIFRLISYKMKRNTMEF